MHHDVAIIGAGIVGLATAYQLIQRNPGLKLLVIEKEAGPARHQTGRNSGVIHSGVYYKPGSLKAQNCLAGKQQLIAFATSHNIAVQTVGKVILATASEQLPKLDEIEERGKANGLSSLERIGPERLKEIEPHATCLEGLYLPDVSIISYARVAEKLVQELQQAGVTLVFGESATDFARGILSTSQNEYPVSFLINCAGLFSDRIAEKALQKKLGLQIFPFRGEYYALRETSQNLVRGLIYPVPDPRFPFLGVHLTRRIDGAVEAGPNAILARGREAYSRGETNWSDCLALLRFSGFWRVCAKYWKVGLYELARSQTKALFLRDLRKLIPCLSAEDLVPSGSGIRAQLVDQQGKLQDDFVIHEENQMIHVLNAPSPAATASFAIGEHIALRYTTYQN